MTSTPDSAPFVPTLNDALAEEVRVRLAAKRLPNKALAEALHVSHGQVTQRLKGTVEWKLTDIDLAAGLLGMTAADLVKRASDAYEWIQADRGNPWTHGEEQPSWDVWADVKGWPVNDESPRRGVPGGGSTFLPIGEAGTPSGTRTPNPLIKCQSSPWSSVPVRGGQVIPLHPRRRHGAVEQGEQPYPAVVIPLYPARRRGDVAIGSGGFETVTGCSTYVVDWTVAS